MKPEIDSKKFTYSLPEDRIATYPLASRDESKLLCYRAGQVQHLRFKQLTEVLPANASLFFNDTRVIPARLLFAKETGAQIEIFLLNPSDESESLQHAMETRGSATWKCTVGNLKRWKQETTLRQTKNDVVLNASLLNAGEGIVEFTWSASEMNFSEIIQRFGVTPLPPYLHREAEELDRNRYQTVYSHHQGAVAAPTAGLHFTEEMIDGLKLRGILTDYLTLHVSAGTFQPIKTENAFDHPMHAEQLIVTRTNVENLLQANRTVIAVGTTSMRTLESLYWYGVKLIQSNDREFVIHQHDPYREWTDLPTPEAALAAVLKQIPANGHLLGKTSIFMVPGYKFRICKGLITNFHQPGSTLMLLVAAFVGSDWQKIYESALQNGYRFLSYGDSSFLLP